MKLDFNSARGDILPLSSNELFDLTNVDGQTSAAANISSSVIGGIDGDTVNNIQALPRTIIFDLRIKDGIDVEYAKREILKVIKIKQNGALVWEQNDRVVTISGKVESIEMPRWQNGIVLQVTLHCAQPFWQDIDDVVQEITEAINLHYFTDGGNDMLYFPEEGIAFGEIDTLRTKTFYNAGDVETGVEIDIIALDTVTNPIIYSQDGDFFGVGYGEGTKQLVMASGDKLTITTHKGNKTALLNGVNIFDKIKPSSTWLQMATGNNQFAINSDDESTSNMSFSLIYKQKYI